MAGPEMNGAARCRRRLCQPGPRRVARGGAHTQGLPHPPRFTLWEPGGGAGPRTPPGASSSARPLPALPPPRWAAPPEGLRGRSPPRGPRSRGGGRRAPRSPPSFAPVPLPARGFGDRGEWSAGTGRAKEREKRSAPCRFCKIAVTTLYRGVGGEREESDPENGNLDRGFHWTTHLLFLFDSRSFPSPTTYRPTKSHFNLRERCHVLLLLPQKSPPVSKRAATSLVLSKPLPAFSLLYPYKVVFRFQPEHILLELSKSSSFQIG